MLFILFFILVLQTNYLSGQVVENGLVSYWSFDNADVQGSTVRDLVGRNDGTLVGDPQQISGKFGDAFQFDGAPDAIDVGSSDDGSLDFGEDKDFSMMGWIKVDNPPETDGGESTIISKGDGGNNARFLWKIAGTQVFVTIANEAGAGPKVNFTSAMDVVDGNWHHVVVVADRSEWTRIYIDGKFDAEAGATEGTNVTTESRMYIGASVRIGETTRRYFEGLIDEVGIYNRVLTENDISHNFNSQGLAVSPQEKLTITWGEIKATR